MPEINSLRDDLRELRGLHLWHAGLSNCSQRVRMVLEEKGLSWTSHMLDLMSFEHASEDYQSIHPKGLVPLLIHDGRIITDSNDIIAYVDEAFPPARFASGVSQKWLDLADSCQLALRTLSHEILLGDTRRLDEETLALFGRKHRNREFYGFLHRFSTEGFDDAHLQGCAAVLTEALGRIDEALADGGWLSGAKLGLADFSWAPNVHRLDLMSLPLTPWPHVRSWFARVQERPSFGRAITAFEAQVPLVSVSNATRLRSAFAAATT